MAVFGCFFVRHCAVLLAYKLSKAETLYRKQKTGSVLAIFENTAHKTFGFAKYCLKITIIVGYFIVFILWL